MNDFKDLAFKLNLLNEVSSKYYDVTKEENEKEEDELLEQIWALEEDCQTLLKQYLPTVEDNVIKLMVTTPQYRDSIITSINRTPNKGGN